MFRPSSVLLALVLFGSGAAWSRPAPAAWPHRALVTSLHQRPVAFRAYTLGGDLIIAVDASGRRTSPTASSIPHVLTAKDTIRAETPADFPLDLSRGPVVFIAEGTDSLHLVVGRNPYGSISRVSANGRRLTARLDSGRIVIDAR